MTKEPPGSKPELAPATLLAQASERITSKLKALGWVEDARLSTKPDTFRATFVSSPAPSDAEPLSEDDETGK